MTAAGFALAILLPIAQAQTPPPVTGNLSFVGDYRFRGISQTYTQPAVQAGVDYASNVGAYVGAWGSNVSGNQFRRLCRSEYLNYLRVREWQDVFSQLR